MASECPAAFQVVGAGRRLGGLGPLQAARPPWKISGKVAGPGLSLGVLHLRSGGGGVQRRGRRQPPGKAGDAPGPRAGSGFWPTQEVTTSVRFVRKA